MISSFWDRQPFPWILVENTGEEISKDVVRLVVFLRTRRAWGRGCGDENSEGEGHIMKKTKSTLLMKVIPASNASAVRSTG